MDVSVIAILILPHTINIKRLLRKGVLIIDFPWIVVVRGPGSLLLLITRRRNRQLLIIGLRHRHLVVMTVARPRQPEFVVAVHPAAHVEGLLLHQPRPQFLNFKHVLVV